MQIMIQAAATENSTAEFQSWCLEALGPALLSAPELERIIVNLALPIPVAQPYGSDESLQGDDFDAVIQIWTPQFEGIARVLGPLTGPLLDRTRACHVYRLTETEVLRKSNSAGPGVSPGIKLMRGLFLYEDLPDAAAQRMWAHHSNLAVKVHVGLARYARHWVDAVLTPGSPSIRGLSDLHFPDEAAMRDRYFDSPRGRDEILHDLGHFICGGTRRFYGREHILR